MASFTPWLLLLAVPIVATLPLIYPWAAGAAPRHLQLYLSWPVFAARSLIALVGWSGLARLFGRGRPSQLAAGIGLVFHAVMLSLIPVDWAFSLQPGWTTTDIAMSMAALQILAATSALLVVASPNADQPVRDIAALQIAGLLGLTYLTFMAFLIDWYGNLPERVDWWAAHFAGGRYRVLLAALAVGAVGPLAARLLGRRLRTAGMLGLAGTALYAGWLVSAAFDGIGGFIAVAGVATQAALVVFIVTVPREREPKEARVHG